MKLLLIYPALDAPLGINHGLAMLSGVLKAHGHKTRLIHVHEKLPPVPDYQQLWRQVQEYQPDVIGFSILSQQFDWSCQAAAYLRSRVKVPLIAGGIHCTMVPEQVLQTGLFDYIFVGEAEYSLLNFVEYLAQQRDPRNIPGIGFLDTQGPVIRPVGPFPSLASLPPKDYGLFDLQRILKANGGWLSIITSRGCPYRCSYCFNHEIVQLYQRDGAISSPREYLRHYPVERVMAEIESITKEHRVNFIIFDDDLFTLDTNYVIRFSELYRRSGIGRPFVVNAHVQNFNDRIAQALQVAGCRIVKFGLESGSERVRREVLCRYTPEHKIKAAFASAHRYGLHSSAFIMLGLPHEGPSELKQTLALCADLEVGRFRWAFFYPYPGTRAYEISQQCGLLPRQDICGGNYFDRSFLDFGVQHNLWLDKLAVLCHWYVNAFYHGPAQEQYRRLVEEVDSWDRATWESRRESLREEDRRLSEQLLAQQCPHYMLRYTKVMAVHTDYLQSEESAPTSRPVE